MAPEDKPFQLDPKAFKTGNFIIDKAIEGAVKQVNKADLNHDGVPDISQFVPLALKLTPLLVALDAAVDFEKVAEQLAENPAIKDKHLFKEVLLELGKLSESGAKLLPH